MKIISDDVATSTYPRLVPRSTAGSNENGKLPGNGTSSSLLESANILAKRLPTFDDGRALVFAVTSLSPPCTGCGMQLCCCYLAS